MSWHRWHHHEKLESDDLVKSVVKRHLPSIRQNRSTQRTAWLRVLTEILEEYRRKTNLALR
jgi:hypothetical protein